MSKSAKRRSYKQFCGLARALDIVGERWTLLLVRELLLGPRRYSDLLDGLPGITTNLLARRLRHLQGRGLIEKVDLEAPARGSAYRLTPLGRELEPVVMALGRFGGRYLSSGPMPEDVVNLGWGMVSLKRRYRGGEELTIDLNAGGRRFQLRMSPKYLDVREAGAWPVDLVVSGELPAVQQLFFLGGDPDWLRDSGRLTVEGEQTVWARFLAAFGLGQANETLE